MPPQLLMPRELLVAGRAGEAFLPRVDDHVLAHVSSVSELLPTHRATEWLFPRVAAQVSHQRVPETEHLPTLKAGELPYGTTSVFIRRASGGASFSRLAEGVSTDAVVESELMRQSECFAAGGAAERRRSGVAPRVSLQLPLPEKNSAANRASEALFSCVSLQVVLLRKTFSAFGITDVFEEHLRCRNMGTLLLRLNTSRMFSRCCSFICSSFCVVISAVQLCVSTPMVFQLIDPVESLATSAAAEQFFSCVAHHVVPEVHLLNEPLVTERADEGLLSSMDSHVGLQI